MDILYKLSFTDKQQSTEVLNSFEPPLKPLWQGKVPVQKVYDEDGVILNDGEMHDDYAVDILTKVEIPELDIYLIDAKSQYRNVIPGFKGIIKTK